MEKINLEQFFTCSCWAALGKDRNTVTLTRYVSDAVYNMTGKRPHVIINTLHRTKLDANRLKNRAAFDDPIAGECEFFPIPFPFRLREIDLLEIPQRNASCL